MLWYVTIRLSFISSRRLVDLAILMVTSAIRSSGPDFLITVLITKCVLSVLGVSRLFVVRGPLSFLRALCAPLTCMRVRVAMGLSHIPCVLS